MLFGVLFALFASLAFRGADRVVHRPLVEDAYYYLQIARNTAQGNGITADGVHLTNGFQPLYFLVCAAAFAVAPDDNAAIRLIIIFLAAVQALAAVLFGRFATLMFGTRGGTAPFVATAAYAGSMFLFWQHQNGLETGLLMLLLIGVGLEFAKADAAHPRSVIQLGVLCGLLVLARIDSGILVAMILLELLVSGRHAGWWRAVGSAGVVAVLATIISAPWWTYNTVYFGSLVPTAGLAQQDFGVDPSRILSAVHAAVLAAAPLVYPFGGRDWTRAAAVSLVPVAAGFLLTSGAGRSWLRSLPDGDEARRSRRYLAIIVSFSFVLGGWYWLSSFSEHFYRRYLSPLALAGVALVSAGGLVVAERRQWVARALPILLMWPSMGLTFFLWTAPSQNVRSTYFDQAELVNAWVPIGAGVGAFQSGTLGFLRRDAVNLDGKVNAQALAHRGDIDSYLQTEDIHWICDWPSQVALGLGGPPESLGWQRVAERSGFTLYWKPPRSLLPAGIP